MSEISNALKMLIILKSRGKRTKRELASILEVSEKQIQRYKEKLEQVDIYIESDRGRNGGYYLNDEQFLWQVNITEEEIQILEIINKKLIGEENPFSKDVSIIIDKIRSTRKVINENDTSHLFLVKQPLSSSKGEDEREKILDMQAAIILKQKIWMKYASISSGLRERIICPYGIFQYMGDTYFVAYCEQRNKVLDFKLNRIVDYKILDNSFIKDANFDLHTYLKGCFGIFKDHEMKLKLKIKKPFSQIIKEKIYSPTQSIVEIGDDTIIFKAKMRGKTEIINWILSMGDCVEVLEPEIFREEIKNKLMKSLNNYSIRM